MAAIHILSSGIEMSQIHTAPIPTRRRMTPHLNVISFESHCSKNDFFFLLPLTSIINVSVKWNMTNLHQEIDFSAKKGTWIFIVQFTNRMKIFFLLSIQKSF